MSPPNTAVSATYFYLWPLKSDQLIFESKWQLNRNSLKAILRYQFEEAQKSVLGVQGDLYIWPLTTKFESVHPLVQGENLYQI